PKRSWESWWASESGRFEASAVGAVSIGRSLPAPGSGERAIFSADSCPPDDVWSNGSLDDVPSPRQSHTAVWTGSEMIVWGGTVAGFNQNSGGRYDPAIDAGTQVSTTNAPEARSNHTAVWTGTEMLVWGGFGSTALATGGRDNPAPAPWTAPPTAK